MGQWWQIAVVVLCAAIVQGVTGFAFGILSMAFLTLLWEPQSASVVVTLLAMWSCLHTLWDVRRGIRWPTLGDLAAGFVIGIPLGTWVLVMPDSQTFLRLLVALVCLVVAWQNLRPQPESAGEVRGRGFALIAGTASGFLSGSVSSGGPPILWYVYRQPWTRDELKATSLAMFTLGGAIKILFWLAHDVIFRTGDALFTRPRLLLAACLVPLVALGSAIGVRIFQRVDREQLRRIICILLIVTAAFLIYKVGAG